MLFSFQKTKSFALSGLQPRPQSIAEQFSERYARQMRDLVSESTPFSWKSEVIKSKNRVSSAQVDRVLEEVFASRKLRAEVARVIDQLGGPQSPRLWNLYFQRCYNAIEGMSHGYISLLLEASRHLPKTGTIYDCGGGTGNFSTALLCLGSQRKVKLFDMSAQARRIARQTAGRFKVDARLTTISANLNGNLASGNSAEGIVLNNVLYTLGDKSRKLAFLKNLHSILKPGGVLVLNDPCATHQSAEALRGHLKQVVGSAAYHRSPMTQFDVALYTEVNCKVLAGQTAPFLSQPELISLAHKAGFALIAPPETRFYGVDTLLILRKVR